MDRQDTLVDTFRSVKRQRRATHKASASGPTNAPRRTLFSPVKQDEMVEKCKGVPEWRVRAPVPGVHAHGSGIVYVAFSSLEAALNYANVLRNPPPPKPPSSKPPRVDSRTNRKRPTSKKRSAARRDEESDDRLLCNTDEIMRVVVAEDVKDAFSRALGDIPVEPSIGSDMDGPRLECDEELDGELEDASSNAGSESTECQMRVVERRQVVVSPPSLPAALVEPCTPPSLLSNAASRGVRSSSVLLEPPTPLSVRTVRHVSRQSRPAENALSTTLFGTHTKQPSFPFVLPEPNEPSRGNDRPVPDTTTPKRRMSAGKGKGARRRAECVVGATPTGADASGLF